MNHLFGFRCLLNFDPIDFYLNFFFYKPLIYDDRTNFDEINVLVFCHFQLVVLSFRNVSECFYFRSNYENLLLHQGSRIEDQRSFLPNEGALTHSAPTVPDDDFFSLIMRFQSGRLEDQRSTMPLEASHNSIHASNADEEEPPSNQQSVGAKDGLVSRLVKGRK